MFHAKTKGKEKKRSKENTKTKSYKLEVIV